MNIRKTIITTAVALTTVAMIAPMSAGAVTIAELQAQINALMAQLNALQASSTTTSTPAVCVGVTFSRNLTTGATGSDVKCLQALLNTSSSTQVSASGAGSPGNETTYFGSRTLAAVKVYQAQQGFTPANQVGPLTRAKLNAWLGGSPSTPSTPTTPVPTGAGLSVMLASTNPATGTIVDGQALAPLAKLTFVNGDNAEVKVTGLKLKRIGVSADASLTNVYLFNGVTRLTDGAAVSTTMINFNSTAGLFTVPSGGSTTISVLSDVDGTSGETVGVQLVMASDVTTNASSVKGTYPLTGNLMTIATGTLAGVEWNASTTPAAASVDPQDGYTVFQNSVIVTTRAVDMQRISFKKTGSVALKDLQNFKLYVDGVQIGSTMQLAANSIDAGSYVTFDLTGSPKKLEAGTRVIKVLADIVGGSNLNFTMHLWNSADVTVVDTQYMANVLSDLISNAAFTKRSTGEQTVNAGTITITKLSDSPAGDIVDAASNTSLAKFQLKAAGEKVKIETLYVSAVVSTSTVGSLRNGMLLANGVQIGSTSKLHDDGSTTAKTTFSLGSSLIVEPGSPVILEVKADIFDDDGTNNIVTDTTIKARLEGASTNDNATGMVSATTLDVPAADTDGNTLTVKQGTLTLSKYTAYTNHTVVAPLTAYKLAHYTLTAATSEAVNVTAINVVLDEVSSYTTNLYVKYGTQTTSIKPTVAATNTWSINYNLPAGQTVDLLVYGDISSDSTSGTGTATVDADGTTASSAVAANSAEVAGQDLTYSTGVFATAFANTPQNQVVSGNQQVEAGRFKFTSSYRAYTITEIRIDPDIATNSSTNAENIINFAVLKDGSTELKRVAFAAAGYYYFTGLNVAVPASTSKTLTVDWILEVPSATNSTSGLRIIPRLNYTKYRDDQGTESTETTDRDGNSTYVYKSLPILSSVNLDNSAIITMNTPIDLYSFKVTAPSQGEVSIKQFKIALGWSDAGTADAMELESLKFFKNGVDITTSVRIQDEDSGALVESTSGVTENNAYIIVTWDGSTDDSIPAGTSTTYTIRGTPQEFRMTAGTEATDSVSLQLVMDTATSTADYDYLTGATTPTTIIRLATAAGGATNEDAVFIWADNSTAVAHSASITAGTADWANGYLLKDTLLTETWSR